MTQMSQFLSFDKFYFPKVARILFIIGAIFIVLATLISIISTFASWAPFGTKLGISLATLLGGLFSIIGLRIGTELALVLFSIDETLKSK